MLSLSSFVIITKPLIINKHPETIIRIKFHVLINVIVNNKFLIINKYLETLMRIA